MKISLLEQPSRADLRIGLVTGGLIALHRPDDQ